MLTKRIIPCLDVKDNVVVKGVQFRNHEIVGDILTLASAYAKGGADELVFYDITASTDGRAVAEDWVTSVAKNINIPFCVAGGIRTLKDAERRFACGADKISINSPALERPEFINELVAAFGSQSIVAGIDSIEQHGNYSVCQYTGRAEKTMCTDRTTLEWVSEVADRGAGEVVLNCMNQDGVRSGYDINHLKTIRAITTVPLIASGGAGAMQDFTDVFEKSDVDGALAASVFHKGTFSIKDLKSYLNKTGVRIRK